MSFSSSRMWWMRCTSRRRSASSWVSPGPLVPMPPACWESEPPARRSRGSRYCSSASSTWALPSGRAGVLGEDVQDHRGAVDRGASEDLLQVALLGRREVVFEDHRVRVDARDRSRATRRPCPNRGTWRGRARHDAARRAPRRRRRRCRRAAPARRVVVELASVATPGNCTPTSTIFSRNVRSMSVVGIYVTLRAIPRSRRTGRVPRVGRRPRRASPSGRHPDSRS